MEKTIKIAEKAKIAALAFFTDQIADRYAVIYNRAPANRKSRRNRFHVRDYRPL